MTSGYRVLSDRENELVRGIKEGIGPLIEMFVAQIETEGADDRWSAIARTHFQQGLMALTRSVTKPTTFA